MTWQPIETAPKDRLILVWSNDRPWTAWWEPEEPYDEGVWPAGWHVDYEGYIEKQPTHWMPLPLGPRGEVAL